MRPAKKADLCATADAIQRKVDGVKRGQTWDRRNPYGKGGGRSVFSYALLAKGVRHMPPRPPIAGRNERCPCGSGKKYKRCCRA